MSRCQRVVTVVVGVMAWAAVARGQEAGVQSRVAQYVDERDGLGLDAAIARAVAREPSLRADRTEIDVAHGLRRQAALRPNPMLRVERRDEPGGTDTLTAVGVEWPLDLFRRSGRVQAADRALARAQLGVEDHARLLVAEVRLRYGAAAAAVREVAVTEDLVTAAQRQFDLVRARVDAGSTPPLDRDLLEVEVRRLDAARLIALGRADVAVVELKQVLGMAPNETLRLHDPLDVLVASSVADAAGVAAVTAEARPDVREAAARVTLAEARIDQAHREGRFDVSLFGSYMRMDSGFAQQGVGTAGSLERVRGRFHYVSAGAAVTIPLLNRNQGQVAAAEAERVGAEARREALDLAARTEVAAAQARDAQARRAFHVYASGVRDQARQNLDVVQQTFDLGRATVFDVLAEQRRYLEIEQGYITAAREVWEARVALTRAMGETK